MTSEKGLEDLITLRVDVDVQKFKSEVLIKLKFQVPIDEFCAVF